MSPWSESDVRQGLLFLVPDLPAPQDRFEQVKSRAERRRRRRAVPALAAATVGVVLLSQPLASGDHRADVPVATPTAPAQAPLTVATWHLVSYEQDGGATAINETDGSGRKTTLRIDRQGRFIARTCNEKSGTVTITAANLTFGDVTTTEVFCVDPVERAIDQLLASRPVIWSATESTLTLTTADGSAFRFVNHPLAPTPTVPVQLAAMEVVDDLAQQVSTLVADQHLTGLSATRVDYATRTVYLHWVGPVPAQISQVQRDATDAQLVIAAGKYTEERMDAAAGRVINAFRDRAKHPFMVTRAGRGPDGSGIAVSIAPPGTYGTPALSTGQLLAVKRNIAARAAPVELVKLDFQEPGVAAVAGPATTPPYTSPDTGR